MRPYSQGDRFANDILPLKISATIPASLAAGFLAVLPSLPDRAETVRAVGSGLAASAASWGDRMAALAFKFGGWDLADGVRLAGAAIPWCLGFLVLFWASSLLRGKAKTAGRWVAWLLCAGVAALGVLGLVYPASAPIRDHRLLSPVALVDLAKSTGGRIFLNPSARPAVAPIALPLLDNGLSESAAAELVTSPEKWRAEDRAKPFSAVLIAGDVFEARTLIQHLREAPDWFLARVDNQGLFFLRGDKPDQPASQVPEFDSPRDRAIFLAQYALNLEAAGFRTFAASSMDEALTLAGTDPGVLVRAASLSAAQSAWERARKQAAAALKLQPDSYQANYLLALSLLETRAYEKAFVETSALKRKHPNDSNVLILHARAAHAAHDFDEETHTLEHLLKLAQDANLPTARVLVFLAQSWAQREFPEQALQNYQAALDEGLTPEEARAVREAMKTIEANRLR